MELVSTMKDFSQNSSEDLKSTNKVSTAINNELWQEAKKTLTLLLAPFAPHITEEVWVNYLGEKFSIHRAEWPVHDPSKIVEDTVSIIVQVNGKLRGTVKFSKDKATNKDAVLKSIKSEVSVAKWLEGKEVRKVIFVPGKLVNFVV
jgi:leucyl-tRNA synthetase